MKFLGYFDWCLLFVARLTGGTSADLQRVLMVDGPYLYVIAVPAFDLNMASFRS
jgi:hypothetical protein